MLPDALLHQVSELAEAYARAHTCRNLARVAGADHERAHLDARADYWDAQVADRYARLTVSVNSAIPPTVYTVLAQSGCVRLTADDQVEVRGDLDHGARTVSIRLTAPQAVAAGAAMIACATVAAKRAGGHLADILPPVPPSPPEPITRSA